MLSLLPLQGTPLRAEDDVRRRRHHRARACRPSRRDDRPRIRAARLPSAQRGRVRGVLRRPADARAGGHRPGPAWRGSRVFTTDDPTAALATVVADMLARPCPQPDAPFKQTDLFDDYCVYAVDAPHARLPVRRRALRLRPTTGGGWVVRRRRQPRLPAHRGGRHRRHHPARAHAGRRVAHRALHPHRRRRLAPAGRPRTAGHQRWPAHRRRAPGQRCSSRWPGCAGASVDGPHEDLRNLTNDNEDLPDVQHQQRLRPARQRAGVGRRVRALRARAREPHASTSATAPERDRPGQVRRGRRSR